MKYQSKILDLQRRLKNLHDLLGLFEMNTRIRIFKIKAEAEQYQEDYEFYSKRLERQRSLKAEREKDSLCNVAEGVYKTISKLANQTFQAAVRRNRSAASLFYEIPRCVESMEYILMRLKVLEQERCQITANNVKWIASRVSSMISSIVDVHKKTLAFASTFSVEDKGSSHEVRVPKECLAGMEMEAAVPWPSNDSFKKVFKLAVRLL